MNVRHVFKRHDVRMRCVSVCRKCGLQRREVFELEPRGAGELRELRLFALPGRTEWTTTDRRCADVRKGQTPS